MMSFTKTVLDSWVNALVGMGKGKRDKASATRFAGRPFLDDVVLEKLYVQSGLVARIVDQLPDDMTREKFTLEGADEHIDWNGLRSKLDDIKFDGSANKAMKWSRLHGGSLMIPLLNDGGIDLREPLDKSKIRSIDGFEIIESRYAKPMMGSRMSLLDPDTYIITTNDAAKVFEIHKSRVYRLDGIPDVPRGIMIENSGWGPSVIERMFDEIKGRGESFGAARSILYTISQPVLKLADFKKTLKEGGNAKQALADMIGRIQEAASILGWLTIDAEDEFQIIQRSLDGLNQLLEKNIDAIVHVSDGMPREILLGETPGGLNTGELSGPFRAWYDRVAIKQDQIYSPLIDWVLDLLFSVEENAGRTRPDEWQVKFNPLWQETEKEKNENNTKKAQTDKTYFEIGAVSAEEIRKARFIDHTDISVEPDAVGEPLDLELPETPEEEPAPEAANEGPDVQSEALAGGQISSLIEIVKAVRAGEITPEDAAGILGMSFPRVQAGGLIASLSIPVEAAPVEEEDEGEPLQSPHAPPENLMRAKDIAAKYGVSAASIHGLHKRGRIEGWKVGGRWSYSPTQVAEAVHHVPRPEVDDSHRQPGT